ncbi:MAG: Asp/Glu racemase [Pseudomonadota bacterium]
METFSYAVMSEAKRLPAIGLIVLQSDETIEQDFRRLFSPRVCDLYISRVPSGLEVTADTLVEMAQTLPTAVNLFPQSLALDVVGYGCTSGSSVIGPDRVAALVQEGRPESHAVPAVTEPLSALIAACKMRGITRLALLSPYIEDVSAALRARLFEVGIETPLFGSFNEAEEAKVARIDEASIVAAATALCEDRSSDFDGLFLSCTNLKALDVLTPLEERLGVPVMSSNSVLADHMGLLAGIKLV